MHKLALTGCLLISVALTGCVFEPPSCNDAGITADVKRLLLKAYAESFQEFGRSSEQIVKSIDLEFPMLIAYDDATKKRSCKATAIIRFDSQEIELLGKWLEKIQSRAEAAGDFLAFAEAMTDGGGDKKLRTEVAHFGITNPEGPKPEYKVPMEYRMQLVEGTKEHVLEVTTHGPKNVMRLLAQLQLQIAKEERLGRQQPAPAIPGKTQVGGFPLHSITLQEAMVRPVATKACGEESLCVLTSDGMFHLNAVSVDEAAFALIETAIKSKTNICMRGISPLPDEADHYAAESIRSNC